MRGVLAAFVAAGEELDDDLGREAILVADHGEVGDRDAGASPRGDQRVHRAAAPEPLVPVHQPHRAGALHRCPEVGLPARLLVEVEVEDRVVRLHAG